MNAIKKGTLFRACLTHDAASAISPPLLLYNEMTPCCFRSCVEEMVGGRGSDVLVGCRRGSRVDE